MADYYLKKNLYTKIFYKLPLYIEDSKTNDININHGFRVMSQAFLIANARVRMLSINYFNDLLYSLCSRLMGGISLSLFHMLLRDFVYFYNAF